MRSNWARIEARYYELDLMQTDVRKLLNLTFGWLIDLIGGSEDWDKHYKPIFDPDSMENDTVTLDPNQAGLMFD